ncbi:MAG: hypothetical protein K2W96_27960 [Gemmataceae bacterium]|nr:hypothetical protein [Gemmataceae bacterium]
MARLLLVLLLAVPAARACSVPVFRYALERWKPASFPIVAKGDRAEVRYPDSEDDDPPLWSGPAVGAEAIKRSPARDELARLLASGESVVWLLLLSGDAAADRAAEALLRGELARLETVLALPPEKDTRDDLLSPVPLRLSFAVLRVRRDDPAEAVLVKQLLDLDDALAGAGGPMAFPVFGRGRVLCGLVGDGLSADEIASSSKYLCGSCSCTVKNDSPGRDLLMEADWPRLLMMEDAEEKERPAPVIAPGVKDEDEEDAPPPSTMPWWLGAGAVLGVLALAAWRLAR